MYAHALIELEDGTRFKPGDEVPADLPGMDELTEAGSVSDEEYVAPEPEPASEVVVDGHRYVLARGEGGTATDEVVE